MKRLILYRRMFIRNLNAIDNTVSEYCGKTYDRLRAAVRGERSGARGARGPPPHAAKPVL